MMRTKEQIGNIQPLIEEVERATREFETAVEGPEFHDYASDEHAYRALEAPARALNTATADILAALNPSASHGPAQQEPKLYRGSPFPYASDEAKALGCTCRPLGPTNRICPVHDGESK